MSQTCPLTKNPAPETAAARIKVTARCGKRSGCVLLTASHVPDTCETEIQICRGDPKVEANWQCGLLYQGFKWRELSRLPPGRIFHFRGRWVRGDEYGPWSPVVSLMVH